MDEIANENLMPKPSRDALRRMIKTLIRTLQMEQKEKRRKEKEREREKEKDLRSGQDSLDFALTDNEVVCWGPHEVALITITILGEHLRR